MSLNIDSLPNELLLVIFDRIPLLDLLRLDQICPRWAKLLPSACARRHTLVLLFLSGKRLEEANFSIPFNNAIGTSFEGREPYFDLSVAEHCASLKLPNLIPDSSIDCRSVTDFTELARFRRARLSGQLVTYFTDLFPNVDNLVVIHPQCNEGEIHLVIGLLGFWSVRILKLWIQTLGIDSRYLGCLNNHPLHTLLHSINQQSSLRQLTLDICGDQRGITFPSESYSFIAQLKVAKLYLGNYDKDNSICDIVHRFDSKELQTIGLGIYSMQMNTLLNPKHEFTTKVRQIYWNLFFETVGQLSKFCWRYSSLTMLRMYWSPDISFTQLATNLARLKELIHLKLDHTYERHPKNAFALAEPVDGDEEQRQQISLPQLKNLVLIILNRSHDHFESLSPLVFPSVEEITLNDMTIGCIICKPNNNRHDLKVPKRCHELLILSLKEKFCANNSAVRLYAKHGDYDTAFVDWTNYMPNEDDNL